MTQFDWQADEDESLGNSPPPAVGSRGSRLWLLVLASFFFLIAASGLAYWRLDLRQRRMEENLRQDVKATFILLQEAVERKDRELYAHLLASEDGKWQRNQKRLFEKDLILERSFLGLTVQEEAAVPIKIELASEWQQATLSFEQAYEALPSHGLNGTVRLLHTAVYEMQDATWLQVEPDESFWGEWQTEEGEYLVVRYPERDARLVQRIRKQLEAELRAVCPLHDSDVTAANDACARIKPLFLKMSTKADALNALDSTTGPTLHGGVYQLPSPTLVGLPLDEVSYRAFYKGYTRNLINDVRISLGPTLSLPKQVVRTLCFDHPNMGLKLYMYDPSEGFWQSELPDRTFRFLDSSPDYQGVFLQEVLDDQERIHSRLIYLDEGSEQILLEEASDEIPYRVISSANPVEPYLLLQRNTIGQATDDYSRLDLQSCTGTGCSLNTMPGYMLWKSPDGKHTLLLQGSEIYLSDEDGNIEVLVGTGFSPFWLDIETFGYIRYAHYSSGSISEVVLERTGAESEEILFDDTDLAKAVGIETGDLFIRYVTVSPTDPELLLVNASGIRNYAGEYFIFSYGLPSSEEGEKQGNIMLRLQRKGAPGGELSLFTPTGFLPFLPSPDGQHLLISELTGDNSGTWTFLLHDLYRVNTDIISDSFPIIPAQFPSYDWSDDGQWLVMADDGFFRLLAPEQGYEQLIEHDFDYCMFTKWSG